MPTAAPALSGCVGSYPNVVSRAEACRRLGLPEDAFVYLLFGALRPYKGLEELIAAFRQLADPDAVLLAAGQVWPESYGLHLRAAAAAIGASSSTCSACPTRISNST